MPNKQIVEKVIRMSGTEHKRHPSQTGAIAQKRLTNGIEIYQNNEGETEFLYNEIFHKEMYFKHGITLPDNGTVMDVGANIGMFTLYVSSKSSCRVYAFEPLPPTFNLLEMNTSSLPHVTTVNVGLSNEIKEAEFAYFPTMSTDSVQIKYRENHDQDLRYGLINHYRDDFADSRMLNRFVDHLMSPKLLNEQIYRCKLTTISAMIRYYDLNQIDLLKIDVEKSEFEVLEGIHPEDWGKIKQIVMEVHGLNGEQISRLENIFRTNGFDVLIDYYEDLNIPNYYNVYALNQMHKPAVKEI
ncbi:FkbM family methyltransferase [Paenibacillus sp. PR3]|uniref:FkbM family methyltransferase n=1 Tax=Paenibacillus terricola TaxID=2763503 RepID=A0ABR8N6Y9_9BACL|nr:FkbM family methyltransferase [Paenibacillus terricola]MBD3922234.1 FkbM family methyltransferase [Paenibacillus terricola]